ncbi:hypothetical protein RCL1_002566 [Eukaryota sp. TZLM3-RCL]
MSEGADKEIYTYQSERALYGCSWSAVSSIDNHSLPMRLAVSTFVEEYTNEIEILQFDAKQQNFMKTASISHPYPATKTMWGPAATAHSTSSSVSEFLATTGDYLRIHQVTSEGSVSRTETVCVLNGNKNSSFCAPLTSFDWNESSPNLLGTCSIDTTCSIWDLNTRQLKTQLIAHDKEVFDIVFAKSSDLFASVGADGSVRMFDLRALGHSTIMYETSQGTPLLRLAWNKTDSNYLATITQDSAKTIILDVRMPALAVGELGGHSSHVNSICWAPHSNCHVATAGDDKFAFIWDLYPLPNPIEDPMLAYQAPGPIEQLHWSTAHSDWIAITFGNSVQALRV